MDGLKLPSTLVIHTMMFLTQECVHLNLCVVDFQKENRQHHKSDENHI